MTRSMRYVTTPLVILAFLPAILPQPTEAQDATIIERTQIFRTYPYGDPDPVPRMGNIYPYFRFQGYSNTPVERPWTIITLENRYIRVLVAPQIGGKVLGAFEKSTGRPFIYYNRVVKFREIAMRGPWTSGGIEFNFGDIGHAPTTAGPVDYLTRRNSDGSVSCIIGALDLPSRTEWRVEIRLPRDNATFEARSFWFNPTDLSTSLYHWTNVAADADSSLQVLYPGNHFIGHGGEASAWPVDDQGRDLSYYRNNAFGSYKSYHVLGTYTDFFGARWGDFGVIHWSPYTEKPGKKLWIWGLSREGEIWTDLLTDPPNTQYVEIQSGLHFNQAVMQSSRTPFKHMVFAPHSSENFREAWYPFKGLEGVTRATMDGALWVRPTAAKVYVTFCPTSRFADRLSLYAGDSVRYSRKVTLDPLQTFRDSIPLQSQPFEIRAGHAVRYNSRDDAERALQRRIEEIQPMDWKSPHGLAVDARERARQRDYTGALASYRASLAAEPTFLPSLSGEAELLYRKMEYDSALQSTLRALAIDTYDPAANFVYGLVQRKLGRLYDAREAFGIASRSREYLPAACVQLSELACADSNWREAEAFARRSIDHDASNVAAHRLLAVLFRHSGNRQEAAKIQSAMLSADPLSHFARGESYLLSRSKESRRQFTGGFRGEMPHEDFLELAAYYTHLGMFADAAEILSLAPHHPMVDLWLAYLADHRGMLQASAQLLDRAISASPAFVLPHRQEEAEILQWALRRRAHWKLRYYVALLFWHLDRPGDAAASFDACGDSPEYAPFYLARASFHASQPARALADYRRAHQLDPAEWRTSSLLATCLNEQGQHAEALRVCADATVRFPASYILKFLQARTLVLAGDFTAARGILDTLTILPFEGSRIGRDLYRQANLLEAASRMRDGKSADALALLKRARLWPERLGAGKPYHADARLEDLLEARILRAQGDSSAAHRLLTGILDSTSMLPTTAHTLVSALAYRDLGRAHDGQALLTAWTSREPDNGMATWSDLTFHKVKTGAIEDRLRSSLLHPSSGDPDFLLLVWTSKILDL